MRWRAALNSAAWRRNTRTASRLNRLGHVLRRRLTVWRARPPSRSPAAASSSPSGPVPVRANGSGVTATGLATGTTTGLTTGRGAAVATGPLSDGGLLLLDGGVLLLDGGLLLLDGGLLVDGGVLVEGGGALTILTSASATSVSPSLANASLLDRIFVEYYGSRTPVTQVASVTVPEARMLVVQPWDKSLLKEIEKAMRLKEEYFNPKTKLIKKTKIVETIENSIMV